MTDKDNMGARMVPLYAARIEDLGRGDFAKVDCAACGHTALLVREADRLALRAKLAPTFLNHLGLSQRHKVLDLKDRVRCRGCGVRGRAVVSIKRHRIPSAPVRDVDEVMRDRHMHERGMLEWVEHDEIGRIVVPTTPLRIHGADPVDTVPSPKLGQHNREIYGDWLGLSAAEITALEQDGVI